MKDTRWLSESEMDAWMAYVAATHLLERRVEEQLKATSGLTHAQYEILAKLSASPDRRMRMTELAREIVVSKSGLTYQIGQLEKRGLVERTTCPSDDRGVLAVLTDQGVRCLKQTAPGHVAVVRAFLIDRLTPEEIETMRRVMTKALAAMESAPGPVFRSAASACSPRDPSLPEG
ncbi:DNA-binding MarR family transcriptional regulator [Streptosporangium becharense]|uniref:DNA-binding MarR family transcriptional regulator n=1 Tax=Streptosporangium becharense TaxID=1816182 RepID=A0A7W9IL68_9ACTN|nr:MarR family transcriptional regulator [Streptosporangium becharense]MBB2911536.1 DNA-binding MarR family transcriptional regulator [Streptosporangium becharense]MBB5822646.1 DNA-binding MarR family transcriptional regulator [Streptosporangium becharense]